MTRTEALDLDEPDDHRETKARLALGSDGLNWYRSVRPTKGDEYTLILLRSGWSHLTLRVELEPPDTDWIPESQAPADCPRIDELHERRRGPNARKFWPGGVRTPDEL